MSYEFDSRGALSGFGAVDLSSLPARSTRPASFPEKGYTRLPGETFDVGKAAKAMCSVPTGAYAKGYHVVCPSRDGEGRPYDAMYVLDDQGVVKARDIFRLDSEELFRAKQYAVDGVQLASLFGTGPLAAYGVYKHLGGGVGGVVGGVVVGSVMAFGAALAWFAGASIPVVVAPLAAAGALAYTGHRKD